MNNETYSMLSDDNLIALQEQISRELEQRIVQKSKDALQAIKTLIDDYGISIDQVKRLYEVEKKPAEVKYRDTSNPENTWTGRGKRPKWLQAAIENGFPIESFLV